MTYMSISKSIGRITDDPAHHPPARRLAGLCRPLRPTSRGPSDHVSDQIGNEPAGSEGYPLRPAADAEPRRRALPRVPRAAEAARRRRMDRPSGRQHRPHRGDPERTRPVPPGAASEAQVTMTFKDVATALKLLLPNRDQGEIIHAAKNFKVVTAGPDELVVWFTQTLNMSETAGLQMGTPMPDGSRRYTTCTNGGPLFVSCQGRPDPAGHADRVRRHRSGHLGDRGPRPQVQPAPPRPRGAACADDEVAGLLGQAHPPSDEAGGFRSRTASATPRTGASPATCASAGTRPWTSSPRRSTGRSASTGQVRSPSRCRRTTSGGTWATTSARSCVSPT